MQGLFDFVLSSHELRISFMLVCEIVAWWGIVQWIEYKSRQFISIKPMPKILQEIDALVNEFKTHLPWDTIDNVPNRLSIPKNRLKEFAQALEQDHNIRITPEGITDAIPYTGPQKHDYELLVYKGLRVTISDRLQVWRVDREGAKK